MVHNFPFIEAFGPQAAFSQKNTSTTTSTCLSSLFAGDEFCLDFGEAQKFSGQVEGQSPVGRSQEEAGFLEVDDDVVMDGGVLDGLVDVRGGGQGRHVGLGHAQHQLQVVLVSLQSLAVITRHLKSMSKCIKIKYTG